MFEISALNQEISSLSENLEKPVNDRKFKIEASIFSMKTLRFYKMNQPKRMKSSNLLWKFNRQCLILCQQQELTNFLRYASGTTTTIISATVGTK